jgi:cell division septum initiation protein DivIVA
MNKDLDKMAAKFTESLDDQMIMIEAQKKTIEKLTRRIGDLEKQNKELREQAASPTIMGDEYSTVPLDSSGKPVSDEESICITQLRILKNKALAEELTLEETKKAEIYVKTMQILHGGNGKAKDKKPTESFSNGNLLDMLKELEEANGTK